MALFPNDLWLIINCWSILGISHYNYFPIVSCLAVIEFYQSSLQHQYTHFLWRIIVQFAVLNVLFLQYEVFQLQTLKGLQQHLVTSDIYLKLSHKERR